MIEIAMYVLIFVAGAFIGSFLNVISDRLQSGESILVGRSHCDNCKTTLSPFDLVPILSFVFLAGKCRYCKTKLSYYYPFSEFLTGSLFVYAAYISGLFIVPSVVNWIYYVYIALIFSLFVILILSDLKFRLLPNKIVFTGIIISLVFLILSSSYTLYSIHTQLNADPVLGKYLLQTDFFESRVLASLRDLSYTLLSAFLLSLSFYILIIATRGRGMGGGDVKLAFLIGLFNGFPVNLIAIFLGFVFGAVYSLVLLLMKKSSLKDTIPFGPFLILGSIIAYNYGYQFLTWYLSLL